MLKDELEDITRNVGNFNDKLFSHTFEGTQGKAKIENIMTQFRSETPSEMCGLKVIAIEDFETGKRLTYKMMKLAI